MKKLGLSFTLLTIVSCVSNNQENNEILITQQKIYDKASISKSGIITCFPEGTRTQDNKVAHCETSAVAFYEDNLIFGNDKTLLPPLSPIFSINYNSLWSSFNQEVTYYTDKSFLLPQKYEDFSISLDGKYIFALTAFDRVPQQNSDANGSFIYWKAHDMSKASFISVLEGNKKNKEIRKYIAKSLGNPSYFKIEGLAILPNEKMLIGVREQGLSKNDFKYTIKFISVSYQEIKSKIYLKNDFKLIYNFENTNKYIPEQVGLSSIEWDKYNNRLLLMTSFESKKGSIGAYLWTLSLEDILENREPKLVYDKDIPLKFNNKSEGMAILNNHEVFIINDDDRYVKPTYINGKQYYKKANEAIFNIVDFEK